MQPEYVGALAQSVDQQTENLCVPGSIPGGTTFKTLDSKAFKGFFFLMVFELFIPFLGFFRLFSLYICLTKYIDRLLKAQIDYFLMRFR